MSQLNVNTIKNRTGTSGPVLSGLSTVSGSLVVSSDATVSGAATVTGALTVGGVLTYEDVTNVDSVGIVTARTGLEVTANGLVINAGVSTFAADLSIADKIIHTGDTNTAIRFPAADTFTVETGGTEALRVDSSRRLLIGTTSAVTAPDDKVQINSTTGVGIHRGEAGTAGPRIDLTKSRNATHGSNTIVQSGDLLGSIFFRGDDGTDYNSSGAQILAAVDGTPGENDMPGRLVFSTSADGSASPTERVRITSAGRMGVGTNDPSTNLHVVGGIRATTAFDLRDTSGNIVLFVEDASNDARISNQTAGEDIIIRTTPSGGSATERLRIASAGQIGLGGANYGSSGQVITSNGSSSAPTWQDVGGSWNLVATINASAASDATFQGNLDNTYKQYVVVISELVSEGSNNSELRMTFMVGSSELTGSNYDTSCSRTTIGSSTALTINQTDAAFGRISNAGLDTDNGNHFLNAVVWLNGGRSANSHAAMFHSINPVNATNGTNLTGMVSYMDSTSRAVDGVKFFTSSDNFAGTLKLYGLS